MFIPIDSIYIPPDEETGRIREKGSLGEAVSERTGSILRHGQLQPVLVEKLPTPVEGKEWLLIDGEVRIVTLIALNWRLSQKDPEVNLAFAKWGIKPGMVEAVTRESQDPIMSLQQEFAANEDRVNFSWKEKGRYVRRIHDMLKEQHKGAKEKWTAKKTAEYINMSEAVVSTYLGLTDERDPHLQHEAVQSARSAQTAKKQLQIVKARAQRVSQVKVDEKRVDELKEQGTLEDYESAAILVANHGDSREWIKTIPDEVIDWAHWDPPYGGREGEGGAFAGHKAIQTDPRYCLGLMERMVPEIHRVLRVGGWLAMWYTPVHYNWLRLLLQGHKFDVSGKCEYCFSRLGEHHLFLSANYYCKQSPHAFWVNPYPNIWYKPDRVADGHEISRFLVKQTEPFLFAGKIINEGPDTKLPIIEVSGRGNVYPYDSVPQAARRHVNHKPPELLKAILSTISVPGSLGIDPGAGSGSIIEASFEGGRKILTSEIDDTHWSNSHAIAVEQCRHKNYGPASLAEWLA